MSRMPAEQSIVVRFAQMEPTMRGEMLRLMMMFVELPDVAKRQTYTVLSNLHREMVERGIRLERV
jgi:hypothetical protein